MRVFPEFMKMNMGQFTLLNYKQKRVYECDQYRKRGMAIIAIFQSFDKTKHNVNSVEFKKDLTMLKQAFTLQQYHIEVWNDAENMTKEKFLQKLAEAAKNPIHEDSESFAMVIITHGKKHGMLLAYDQEFNINEVYTNFTADKCKALAKKPKLFVFHACRGQGESKEEYAYGRFTEVALKEVSIPAQSDLLLVFSTYDGKKAFGGGKGGSAFIYVLEKVLTEDHQKKDEDKEHILELMTKLKRMVACFKWEDNSSGTVAKQQPVHISTLLSLYYLKKKSVNATSPPFQTAT